jgi:hypothetical protein
MKIPLRYHAPGAPISSDGTRIFFGHPEEDPNARFFWDVEKERKGGFNES